MRGQDLVILATRLCKSIVTCHRITRNWFLRLRYVNAIMYYCLCYCVSSFMLLCVIVYAIMYYCLYYYILLFMLLYIIVLFQAAYQLFAFEMTIYNNLICSWCMPHCILINHIRQHYGTISRVKHLRKQRRSMHKMLKKRITCCIFNSA